MFMLDTNIVIAALNDRPAVVGDVIAAQIQAGAEITLSSIVVFELCFGIAKSNQQSRSRERLEHFLARMTATLPFDDDDAAVAAEVRADLARIGRPIGPYDVLIAGQALRHGATLVTANTREFRRIKGLKIENWTKA